MNCYGIHKDDMGVAYLLQSGDDQNAIGLNKTSGMRVRTTNHLGAVHNIDLSLAGPMPEVDELLLASAPLPNGKAVFVENNDGKYADLLGSYAQMSNPTEIVLRPLWMTDERWIRKILYNSNLARVFLVGASATHTLLIKKFAEMALYSPGSIVISGDRTTIVPSTVKRVVPTLTEPLSDPKRTGATLVKHYMRNGTI